MREECEVTSIIQDSTISLHVCCLVTWKYDDIAPKKTTDMESTSALDRLIKSDEGVTLLPALGHQPNLKNIRANFSRTDLEIVLPVIRLA